ncbi:HAD family phosphatase [Companilactobacillus zhachilii]|uniref:HAD family phosphatase n=1 Tax=Companilactobacillus zhachilii TaxID=2304606 RepID=A0A386PR08_9LACO|nr:Cof-type HAD-IIB family hydrolase [Companilactobacillus zhachilii]AYE38314.1 HAD family phosphatase [Companilactobacillus zhachilii]
MNYKLIAIDIDDTLLDDQKNISTKNRLMISQALAEDVKIVLCSGRPHKAMIKYADKLNIKGSDQYMITNGGAIIENMHGEFIMQKTLSNEFYRNFVAFTETNDLSYCVFDVHGNIYTSNNYNINQYTVAMAFENNDGLHIRKPEDLSTNFEITKAVINGDETKLDEITNFIKDSFADYFVVRTGVGYLEIFPNRVNKGNAVAFLANKLGIDLQEVMTIGDRDNDIPMLKVAGTGVAMGNATAGSKAVCDYITTDNNHDGVGNAIEKFLEI